MVRASGVRSTMVRRALNIGQNCTARRRLSAFFEESAGSLLESACPRASASFPSINCRPNARFAQRGQRRDLAQTCRERLDGVRL
jgi:hypothetical protein